MNAQKFSANESAVISLQERLNQRGASLAVDGWAGRSTISALDKYFPDRASIPEAVGEGSVLGARMVDIAALFVGKIETGGNNQGEWIKPFWKVVDYTNGYRDKQPYCAAALAFCLYRAGVELESLGKLKAVTGMTLAQFEEWRCKSAKAYDWDSIWAKQKGLKVTKDNVIPRRGDLMVFDISHIGIVESAKGEEITTIEFNTGPGGGRDGDGCWRKIRPRSLARSFIWLP